jgi:hypothetical protein
MPPAQPGSVADELKKLVELRDAGVLSAEEFDAQKAQLLGGSGRHSATIAVSLSFRVRRRRTLATTVSRSRR